MDVRNPGPAGTELAALSAEDRSWNGRTVICLWVSMAACVPAWMLTAEMLDRGMAWWQAVVTVLLGSLLAWIPMAVIGSAGTTHGIAFPVLLRSSFGVRGARLAVALRAGLGVLWFSMQLWIGAQALFLLGQRFVGLGSLGAPLPLLGVAPGELLALLAFAALHLWVLQGGMERIRKLVVLAAPSLAVLAGALVLWAFVQDEKGFNTMWTSPSQFGEFKPLEGQFWQVFTPMLAAVAGFWTLLAINISDFTRHVAKPRRQGGAQLVGLVFGMALVALVGVVVTYAATDIYGETLDDLRMADPVVVILGMGRVGGILGMVALLIAGLSTNVTAHGVAPIYGLLDLWPNRFSWNSAARTLSLVAIVLLPWKLLSGSGGDIFVWLTGLSYLLAPIAGILCWDCWAMRRKPLRVDALFDSSGPYHYRNGWNPRALIALACGVLPLVPGFAEIVGLLPAGTVPEGLLGLYPFAAPFGFVVAAVVFAILQRFGPSPDAR